MNRQQKINFALELLKEAEAMGDDLQFILRELSLEDQMLKQLVMGSDDLTLNNALEERESFNDAHRDSLKAFWRHIINTEHTVKDLEYYLYPILKKMWGDIFHNETLIYNSFEEYFRDFVRKVGEKKTIQINARDIEHLKIVVEHLCAESELRASVEKFIEIFS